MGNETERSEMRGCKRLLFSAFLFLLAAPAVAIEMDELMDDVLDGVRQETRENVKIQVQQETREVIAEEQVIPSNTLSGLYVGASLDDGHPNTITCTLNFGKPSGPSSSTTFSGTCTDDEGNRVAVSGTVTGSSFTITLTEVFTADGICAPGTETSTGSGTISGSGEPGTTITGTAGDTCDTGTSSFRLTKN